MPGYTYPDYIEAISSALESPVNATIDDNPFVDANYNSWLPRAIEYAEERIYRELDMMGTNYVDPTGALTPNNRRFNLPSNFGTFIVVTQASVVDVTGARTQLLPVTKEFIDAVWTTDTPTFTPSVPSVWCPFDQASIFVGPSPDQNYSMEITGTIRPNSLSAENASTILTQYLPDLFMAASMISWAGFQRDYGAQSGNPQNANSWEQQYAQLKESAAIEQFRVRFASLGWGARLPDPVAQPKQT